VPRPTRPSNMNFVAIVVQKFVAKVSFWHLSVPPGVFTRASAEVYRSLKYELRSYSCSKVPCQGLAFHFGTFRSHPAFAQELLPMCTRLSNMNFVAIAVQKFLAKVSFFILALFGHTRRFLRSSYQGLLGPQKGSPLL
jgi:hypothetical protein